MTDSEYRIASVLIVSACVFLVVAIALTLHFQAASVVEVVRAPAAEPAMAIAAEPAPTEGSADGVPAAPPAPLIPEGWQRYVEVVDGCGPFHDGECLLVRSGPGEEYPVVSSLRTGVVLKVSEVVPGDSFDWYRVEFDEWLRYPERLSGEWYVAAPFVREIWDEGYVELAGVAPTTTKRIVVDRSDQTLTAYDGEVVFLELSISTGIELTPTPRGEFTIFKKTPTRYMQGPLPYLPVSKYYDLPGVPWNLYFTEQGAVIHGAYWHESFGSAYSSGCVNVVPAEAERLYRWADLGTKVIVRD